MEVIGLKKKVDYNALHFQTGSLKKSTFSKYFGREGGRGPQKMTTLCRLLKKSDNSGRPLRDSDDSRLL